MTFPKWLTLISFTKCPLSARSARNERLITAGGGNFDEDQRLTASRQVELWTQANVLSGIRSSRNERLITAGGANFDEDQRWTALRQVDWWTQAHALRH